MGLVIALNKGRILKECLPLLAACGIEPSEDPDSSRKLIFESRTGGHKLIITRSADVPTYVEQGVADIGVTGKDTIEEYGGAMGFYEVLDLGIGKCRMMTAGPVGVAEPRAYCGWRRSLPISPVLSIRAAVARSRLSSFPERWRLHLCWTWRTPSLTL